MQYAIENRNSLLTGPSTGTALASRIRGMKLKSWRSVSLVLLVVGLAPVAMAHDDKESDGNKKAEDDKKIVLTVDVAEDFSRFVPGPPTVGGFPQPGSFFVTQGK